MSSLIVNKYRSVGVSHNGLVGVELVYADGSSEIKRFERQDPHAINFGACVPEGKKCAPASSRWRIPS